ncbi:MAG: shikimate dehydrogenase [Paramuribaculum sp.]|nr:shikimate dehydrogenase [Paramuribaculum sp.]
MTQSGEKIYGLIGRTLGHSFSRQYFTDKFTVNNIKASYVNFELPDISLFPQLIASNPSLCGLNVTIPYKESIIPYIDYIDDTAQSIGAINTIKFSQGQLCGYNTDIIGFCNSIRTILKPYQNNALILGTGGASKAIAAGLKQLGINYIKVSRTPGAGQISYDDLDADTIDSHTIIINTTPLGTFPDVETAPPIPYQLLSPKHLCYDLVYNPARTAFLNNCQARGCTIKNGLEMLQLQAEASWNIWNE